MKNSSITLKDGEPHIRDLTPEQMAGIPSNTYFLGSYGLLGTKAADLMLVWHISSGTSPSIRFGYRIYRLCWIQHIIEEVARIIFKRSKYMMHTYLCSLGHGAIGDGYHYRDQRDLFRRIAK